MDATAPQWHEVSESEWPHERAALAHVRALLPAGGRWAAWSNFTFVAADGRHRECDLLVAGPSGLHLIEIKSWKGHLSNDGGHWTRGGRPLKNPLDLTVKKAKELQDYLNHEARLVDTELPVPFVQASLFMSHPGMRSSLDRYARAHVYVPENAVSDLPRIGPDLLFASPRFRPPTGRFLELLPSLLHAIGISAARPSRAVGAWTIEPEPYDEGPTWQDFHATRSDIGGNPYRRVRIYLEKKLSDERLRHSVRSAAERELQVARGVHHAGILAPSDLEEHDLGPALIIEQDRSAERLDHWLARHREKVTTADRVGLVRQLTSAVAYAHRRGLVHRALSPRAVIVESGVLRVGEWQVATRDMASSRSRRRSAPTSMSAGHLDVDVEPYLAPDFVTEGVDGTVDVDIFGVGAIAYLILTGRAPAPTRAEQQRRLVDEGCLDPRTGDEALDALVRDATRPSRSERTASVEDMLQALLDARRPRTPAAPQRPAAPTPTAPPAKDPLEAAVGDVLPGGYRVEKVLGTGATARALLVRRDGSRNVLKIGLNADAEPLLAAEAAALEDLRHDHIVVLRRASFAVADRRAIELSNAGERTLADLIAAEGPLRGERLRTAGDQLLSAVEYLADRDVFHRDVKPANVGVRDPFRIALFDFSLAATPPDDVSSGTRGYLDPRLGVGDRTVYDSAAEQHAVAATLHELATGTLPQWGDDGTAPAFVPAATLAEDAVDPTVRAPLVAFLQRGLARSTADRFGSLRAMREAWNAVFAAPTALADTPVVAALDVHVDVVAALRRLDPAVRARTVEAIEAASTPAPRLTAPAAARDDRMRLLAVDDELAGVVLLDDGAGRGLLLHLDAPGAAATWARDHAASVNHVSGELELRDAVALDRLADTLADAPTDTDLFAHVDDALFARLGVDPRIVDYARAVPSVAELERAQPILPALQYGVLLALARGASVDDVLRGLVGPTTAVDPVDQDDVAAAVRRSSGRIAMLEDLEELRRLLERPISQFATFLHPSQHKLAYRANWGSMQVTGGPGTGKTVVALHRVKHLAETKDLGPGSILLTTFTRGLADALERDLRQMVDADLMASVQVTNIDSWAHGIVREHLGRSPAVLEDKDRDARWRRAAAEAGTDRTPAFLHAEWEQVVLAQQVADEDTYLACARRGRGTPLTASQRRPVWRAIEAFTDGLRTDGKWTYRTVVEEAARLLTEAGPPFAHVVVDEIQDLHPGHWRLLRAAVKPKPEDLFLTGDPHQRIYGHRVSLKSVGIDIGGRRSTRLSLSYRTSAEILAWSLRMLGDHHETGLDDIADDLAAYRSAFSGAEPDVVGAGTRDEELADLVDDLNRWHDDGIAWADMAVVARSKWIWAATASALRTADVPVVELRRAADEDAVRIGSMHGLKGLEFRAVAVVGVSEGVIPRKGLTPIEEDEVVHRHELSDERNLLFVAATRPRERLRVSWHGAPSPFLPA